MCVVYVRMACMYVCMHVMYARVCMYVMYACYSACMHVMYVFLLLCACVSYMRVMCGTSVYARSRMLCYVCVYVLYACACVTYACM